MPDGGEIIHDCLDLNGGGQRKGQARWLVELPSERKSAFDRFGCFFVTAKLRERQSDVGVGTNTGIVAAEFGAEPIMPSRIVVLDPLKTVGQSIQNVAAKE
ncbi:MAG: hypothetical protein WBF64_00720 [Xanthobacteraceae bacterium]